MKISCICRIQAKPIDKEVVLYAIEAPKPLVKEELDKCAAWVEHAYENGFFNENQGILVNHSYMDKIQLTGVYMPEGISKEYRDGLTLVIGAALQLSALSITGRTLSEEQRALCLKHEGAVQIAQMIDSWIIDKLSANQNTSSKLDN